MKTPQQRLYNAKTRAEKNNIRLKKRDDRFAIFRLVSTVVIFALLFSFHKDISLFILIFSALAVLFVFSFTHKKIQKKQKFWQALYQSYELSIQRMKRNFSALKKHEQPWHRELIHVPDDHVYAFDLDVHSNLFSLLNTCTTRGGSQKLFGLLMKGGLNPEANNVLLKRSEYADELAKSGSFLRQFETLRLTDDFIQKYHKYKKDLEKKLPQESFFWKEVAKSVYAILNIGIWLFFVFPAVYSFFKTDPRDVQILVKPMLFYTALLFINALIFNSTLKNAAQITHDSKIFHSIVTFLAQSKTSFKKIKFEFLDKNVVRQISAVQFLVDLVSLRGNPVFWILVHVFLPFDAILCLVLQWKLKFIQLKFPKWQEELYEFDVISCFARFAQENPDFHFMSQEEREFSDPHLLEMTDIGHPLIAHEHRVCNSIQLTKASPLVLLTGSNMAGKSTFLRTVGTNLLLANIGAPLCAQKILVPKSQILCAIRINDSLSEGTSYFYAEVKRLRFILEQLEKNKGTQPSVFLIDEIFKGTNNRERFVGSWHVIKALLEKDSFGCVSTHDLALCDLEKKDNRVKNMHFREHIEQDKLVFDYLIKEGPCPTSNATRIMRLEGLPVPEEEL